MEKYKPEIDGLRAIAVLAVLAFHLNPTGFLTGGYIGVDVFFVISGYLIIGIIYQGITNNNFNYIQFLERRVARLYPALMFVILVIIVLGFLIYSVDHYTDLANKIKYALFSIANLKFMKQQGYWDISSTESPLLHTWSLGVEQQFYLVFPLLLIFSDKVFKSKHTIVIATSAITLLSFVFAQYLSIVKPSVNFYFTLSRLFELGIGGIFAILGTACKNIANAKKELLFFIGLMLIITCAITFVNEIKYHPGLTTIPVIIGSILCILYGDSKYLGRLVRSKLLVYLGAISYSIYLLHWPLIVFYKHLYQLTVLSSNEQIILFSVTIGISVLTYHFIEKRFRRISISIFTNTGKRFLFVFVLLLIANFSIIYFKGIPQRLTPYPQDVVQKSNYAGNLPVYRLWDKGLQIIGDKTQKPIAIFVGDSYLGQYIEQIDLFFSSKKQSVFFIADSACLFTHNIYLFGNEHCIKATHEYYNIINEKKLPIIRVNNSSASILRLTDNNIYDEKKQEQKASLKMFVNELASQANTKMIIILPQPLILHTIDLHGNALLMNMLSRNGDFQKIGYKSDNLELQANEKFISLIKQTKKLAYIEIYDLFCNNVFCSNSSNEKESGFYYSHSGHLSRLGAKLVWDNIGQQIYEFILNNQSQNSEVL